ncbi:MAG TPA: hypothetical protein VLY23_00075 [Candidatus Acidoferrum sp.]|nr:hypothetical protein [Candidatus Acidoferrum sp.]
MRRVALVGLLAASTCWAQGQASNPQPPASQVQAQALDAPQGQTITIPVGTRIPLALSSTVTTKSRPGNTVRAVTTFPVTVGTQLAIPTGTYVEGVIDKLTRGGRSGPTLQMHFTRILYANGYSVAIEGSNSQAKIVDPGINSPEPMVRPAAFESESGTNDGAHYVLAAQQQQPPPLQPPASHIGLAVGLAVGAAAVGIVSVILLNRHYGAGSGVLFDTGWQFEIVLQSPLSVDAAKVAAAAASGAA